jgi:hypothetical protein
MARSIPEETPVATVVYLGNRKTVTVVDGDRIAAPGKRCTQINLREGISLVEALTDITSPQGIWSSHSDAAQPAWVAASGPMAEPLSFLLSQHWGGIEIREPEPQEA